MSQYYVCFKCNKIGSYAIDNESGDTTFPRGEWLAHNNHIVTGIRSKEKAEEILKNDPYNMKENK